MHNSNQENHQMDSNKQSIERRRFCKLLGAGVGAGLVGSVVAGTTQAQEEILGEVEIDQTLIAIQNSQAQEGTGHAAPNVQLGLAAYSFKEYFDVYKGNRKATR